MKRRLQVGRAIDNKPKPQTQNTQAWGTRPPGGDLPLSPVLAGAHYQASVPGKHVTSVKVDMPRRLLGKLAHSASCSRVWEKPRACFSQEPGRWPCSFCRDQHARGQTARNAQECTPRLTQAEAMWGVRGFQRSLWPSTMCFDGCHHPAHSETQHRALPRQRSCLINTLCHSGDHMRFPSKRKWRKRGGVHNDLLVAQVSPGGLSTT